MQKVGPNGDEKSAGATLTREAERSRKKKKNKNNTIAPLWTSTSQLL